MTAGFLARPGSPYGPCSNINCGHVDCKETRILAEQICRYCHKPIGYDRQFCRVPELVHATCHEDAIATEREKELLVETLNRGAMKGQVM